MEDKPLWKSKTVIGALIAGLSAVANVLGAEYGMDLSFVTEILIAAGSMLGVIGLRDILGKKK